MIYGFSTNIRRLKGVNQQDWNSAQLMSNITLATSYEHRKMDGFVYQCKKQKTKVWNEVSCSELACRSNNLKAMASEKRPKKSAKDLRRLSNYVINSND